MAIYEHLESRRLFSAPLFPSEGPALGQSTSSVAVADFNGDGRADLITASNAVDSVSGQYTAAIRFGQTDGSFSAATTYLVGTTNPAQTVTGDFNGDGKLDVAFSNTVQSVTVLIGRGDGTFLPQITSGANGLSNDYIIAAQAADTDGDGKLDLIASDRLSNQLLDYHGNGDGTFSPPTFFALTTAPATIPTGDYNNDGRADTAIITSSGVEILFGQANGTFSAGSTISLASGAQRIATVDINQDGKFDLVVTTSSVVCDAIYGNGDGTFGTPYTFTLDRSVRSIIVADFNHDGKPDLAVADASVGYANILLGTGSSTGTFSISADFPSAKTTVALFAADVNGDGNLDLLDANDAGFGVSGTQTTPLVPTDNVAILRGRSDGTFDDQLVNTVLSYPDGLVTGDFNGDGINDIASDFELASGGSFANVQYGNGGGTFSSPITISIPQPQIALAAGDFDGDGRVDLQVGIYFLHNNGNTSFTVTTVAGMVVPRQLIVTDLDNDHVADLVAIASGSSQIQLIRGTSSGPAIVSGTSIAAVGNYPVSVVAADFNNDGLMDIATANNTGTTGGGSVSILFQKPLASNLSQAFPTAITTTNSIAPFSIAAADFSGDGNIDIAYGSFKAPSTGVASVNTITVLLGDGSGHFNPQPTLTNVGYQPYALVPADLDGDGKMDLAVGNYGAFNVSIFRGNGDGTFADPTIVSGSPGVSNGPLYKLVVADVNGDGQVDLLPVDYNARVINVVLNETAANPFAKYAGGVLRIKPVNAADEAIILSEAGGTIAVSSPTAGNLTFPASQVNAIDFDGSAANDVLSITTNVDQPIHFHGGGGNDVLNVSGSITLADDLTLNSKHVILNASGNAIVQISGVQSFVLAAIGQNAQVILAAGGSTLLHANALSITGNGRLDLNDGAMIDDYATADDVQNITHQIQLARAGGQWSGGGITSSSAAANPKHNTTLGLLEATDYKSIYGQSATFAGQAIDDTALLIKYTYYGDTDFNGKIDANDYGRIDSGYQNQSTAGFIADWFTGDFNYDGKIDANDYALIDGSYQTQVAGTIPPAVPPPSSRSGSSRGGLVGGGFGKGQF